MFLPPYLALAHHDYARSARRACVLLRAAAATAAAKVARAANSAVWDESYSRLDRRRRLLRIPG
jgi:hypothetical protein